MATKGLSYVKTPWSYEERPVASSKLNTWDTRIDSGFDVAFGNIAFAWGGQDGIIRGATEYDLKVVESSPAHMSVVVEPGHALISGMPYRLSSQAQTTNVYMPIVYSRIDVVQARLETWDVSIVSGTESASPVVPVASADSVVLARLYLRPGMSSIKASDDGVNGYIVDVREFV